MISQLTSVWRNRTKLGQEVKNIFFSFNLIFADVL